MRLLLIIGILAMLSMGIASADNMTIAEGTNVTFADNRTVQIMVNLTNATGHPVNDTRVNFTTTLGTLHASYNCTNASGIAVVNMSSWDLGTANVTAQAPNAANVSVNVTFVRGPVSRIVLAHSFSGTVNTTHLITATVYDKTIWEFSDDENKWRVMPNVTLNFSITPPPSSTYDSANITPKSNTTNESGTTTAIALIDKCAGNNLITVNTTNEDNNMVQVSGAIVGIAGEPTFLFMSANPENISANGIDTSKVTGEVTDEFGNPLIERGSVRFNSSSGDIITKPLDDVGEATITVEPNIFPINVTLNGTYLNETGGDTSLTDNATVVFYREEPARIVVTADATKISTTNIPGVNKSSITATVVDKWGHVLNGRSVNFSTGLGSLSSNTETTDSNGQATVTLQSGTSGDATVTASTFNDSGHLIEGDIVIRIMNESFVSIITTIEPDPIEPGGIINVTTVVSGQGNITGTRYAAHAMLTLDRSGSMDPDYYAGTPLDVVEVLDRSGSMDDLGSDPQQPMTDAKTAAKVFMDNLVSNAQVGVVSFATSSSPDIGLTLLNSLDNKTLVRSAIDGIYASGRTAMGSGMVDANTMLATGRADATKIMIVLTDGVWNEGTDPQVAVDCAKTNGITIYTIGLGKPTYLDEPLLQHIASETGGTYYNAPDGSELQKIYQTIAQEISDYDITEIEYGTEGFTPYDYVGQGSVNPPSIYVDTFLINETINDLKVLLEWDNSSADLNLTLISPCGHVYGAGNDTTGYYFDNTSEYIWIHPLSYTYPDTDTDTVENGNWRVQVTGSGAGVEQFNITTHIDKKSAAKLASHAFISSLDPTRLDRVGLATYSYSSTNETATQESYVCEGNQWDGYFTVGAYGIYYFNLSWTDTSDLDLHLYDGISILDSSNTSKPVVVSAALSPGKNYRIVVNGTNVTGNDTQFTVNVYSTIETVNAGTATLPDTSATVDIPPVDLNKTFLIVKSSDDDIWRENANAFTIRGHFIDNDTIEFTRESNSHNGKVSYFVIQADNMEVQSGTTAFAEGASQKNVSISPVTDYATKCFVTLSTSSDSNSRDYVHESWVTGELTANDTLTLKRAASGNSQVTVDWFVIRFTDNTTVQTGETSWNNSHTATHTLTTSVNTSRTWLYFTSRMTNNELAHTSIKGEITNSTTLTFSKHSDSTAGTDYVRYFVIQFPDDSGATVQNGTASAGSSDSIVDIGITPVNRGRAFAFVTNDCEGTGWWWGRRYARSYWISYFTADNNLRMQRWYTEEPVVHKWQVVEWPKGSAVEMPSTPVNWLEWRAQTDNHLNTSIGDFGLINSSIDNLTADGMTAIDEGLLNANDALTGYENGTIVLMTDGIDNVGYHSMIAEAERAAANNTTIFTVGFGSTIDDGLLRQIANITGGKYHFAPNATVLKSIFVGIAGELGNFTAPEPEMDVYIGNNATIEGRYTNVTYINNSANATYFYCTCADCSEGHYAYEDPSNPNVTSTGNRTILTWDIGNRPDYVITVGKYWKVTYDLLIDGRCNGTTPVIVSPSGITYDDGSGTTINESAPDASVNVGSNESSGISSDPAENLTLSKEAEYEGPPTRHPLEEPKPETIREYAYKLTARLTDSDNKSVAWGALVEFSVTEGTLYNYTHFNTSGLFNETTGGSSNDAVVWLCSDAPGTIRVTASHSTENGTRCNDTLLVTFHSLEAPSMIPPAPRPRGVITLE